MSVWLPSKSALAIEKSRRNCAKSFANFVKEAWHIVEPTRELKWGWALDAVCEHLEHVHTGDILRLLMNVPPGSMKSLLTNVFFPAWEWGPKNRPDLRYLGTAHKVDLARRDNVKCRRLIKSPWYQERWKVKLLGDQDAKDKFENESTGFRECMAFTSLTGSRGDRVSLDDPHSVNSANSIAELDDAEFTFKEALPSRVNDDLSAIIVIMQRLHARDVSGIILDLGLPYVHLCLPMEFEASRRCSTSIGFRDPRLFEGQLLFPERFSKKTVDELKLSLGSVGTAGQLQQRPSPREGNLFKREWFTFVSSVPAASASCRGWDLAATANPNSPYTAGVLVARTPEKRFVICNAVRDQLSPGGVLKLLKRTAAADGYDVKISIPQDPGQAGKSQAVNFVAELAGFTVTTSPETGDKIDRAEPVSAQAEGGNLDILVTGDKVRDAWIEPFLAEICEFPASKFKDQTDALSRAFAELAGPRLTVAMLLGN